MVAMPTRTSISPHRNGACRADSSPRANLLGRPAKLRRRARAPTSSQVRSACRADSGRVYEEWMPRCRASGRAWRSLIALVLALSASGAGGAVLDGLRPHVHHQCRCHHGPGEDCSCGYCRRALAAAADDPRLPPCHRAAAKARLARAAKPATHPCIKGSCGSEDGDAPRAPQHEPLVLSQSPRLLRLPRSAPVSIAATAAGRDSDGPATPPPRAS
jgi:hypothetical protein